MSTEDRWEVDSTEEYEDDDYIQNEVPPPDIDDDFKNKVLSVKHSLYNNIVLAPEQGSADSQNMNILQDYLNKINHVYVLSMNAQKGKIEDNQLNQFPENSKQQIRQTLDWITDYFSKNRVPDTIPYNDYVRKSFHEYQFVQDNSFE